MAKRVRLVSTAYGPPWGGIQGTGVTATGVDLRSNPKQYVVAVDPNVIPLGSKLKIPHNPFGDPNIVFTAADTGGAIKGNRLDFFDWRGRKTQMEWGTRPIEATVVGQGDPKKPQGAAHGHVADAGGQGPTFLPGTPSSGFSGGGADLAAIVQSMMKPAGGGGGGGGLTTPSFSAEASLPMPAGYHPLQTSGGPAAPTDVGSVIRSLLPTLGGGDIPKASSPGLVIPGANPAPAAGVPGLRGARAVQVQSLFERAQKIDAEHLPYKWGGGHGPTPAKPGVPVDCSGAVSRLFGVSPRVSGEFAQWGAPGRGKAVTVYANPHHVLVEINGHFWGTSATNPGGGAGWIPRSAISPQYLKNFTARHPAGL